MLRALLPASAGRMTNMFEELAWEHTPIGELMLRRRRLRPDGDDIWEIKLNDGYLMSSQFVDGEIALADLALAAIVSENLDIVVGGLGLGYTAEAVLRDPRVARLTVVELIPQVIQWHRDHLLPLGQTIADDPRCVLLEADFFALATAVEGFHPMQPDTLHDAIVIDIDHSTTHFINAASAGFYSTAAIAAITAKLKPGGMFALWSTDAEDANFIAALRHSLDDVTVERVEFATPYREQPAFNLIYLGRKP